MPLFIQSRDCFLCKLEKRNTFIALHVFSLSLRTHKDVLPPFHLRTKGRRTNLALRIWKNSHHTPAIWISFFCFVSCLCLTIYFLNFFSFHHHLSLLVPVLVCFLVLLGPLLKSPCGVLQRAPPHHGNSALLGWLHHVTKCFMSHSERVLTLSIVLSFTTASQHRLFLDILSKLREERED